MSRAWPVPDLQPDRPLGESARRILAVRVAEVYAYRPIIHRPEAIEETHNLRISLKRLRYTLELFAGVLGAAADREIDRVRELQEILGDLHDIDVRRNLIALAASSADPNSAATPSATETADSVRTGLNRLIEREQAQRDAVHRRFVERWTSLQQAGMRADLVRLSHLGSQAGRHPGHSGG
ncbi:MAG TPA: CHAD domain-containing protein [Thermomicrobiales bacterium]|jgi:CHAD domain-containing protein|nr:CHAD domain-containing protein [Thermomicrobiales bacterium]